MFKKPKRNHRSVRRKENSSDDDKTVEAYDVDEEAYFTVKVKDLPTKDSTPPPPAATHSGKSGDGKEKKKKKSKKAEKISVLSFGGDEEEETETFKIKKTAHSRRMAKQLKRESKKEQEEKEKEEKAKELKQESRYKYDKREKQEEVDRAKYEEAVKAFDEMAKVDEDEIDEQIAKPSVLSTGLIPDSRMIHEARKQRQRAREQGDFIPLEESTASPEESLTSTAGTKSRLARDDDYDSADDERVNFQPQSKESEREEMRDKILRAEHGSDSDSNHGDMWEEQQIRKAVSIPQTNGTLGQSNEYPSVQDYIMNQSASIFTPHTSSIYAEVNQFQSNKTTQATPTQSFGVYSAGNVPETLPEVQYAQLTKRMEEVLISQRSVYRTHKLELDDMESRYESCLAAILDLEENGPKLADQYRFYQEMRAYVLDIVGCLNEKLPQIELQERMMMSLLKQKADRLIKRRQEDIKDQSIQYASGGGAGRVEDAANEQRMQRRAAEREARRSRRRRTRESRNIKGHQEGMSTDEEDHPSEHSRYTTQYNQIEHDVETMMEDVVEDFSEIAQVRDRFDHWRTEYGDSYQEAYITLCLPKLLIPLVRLAMITWNPLQENCTDFESMSWYEELMLYGIDKTDDIDKTNTDIKLVPTLVEKVIVPKLTDYVNNIWDPLSTQQNSRLISLISKISKDYPTISDSSKQTQTLMTSVVARIQKCLEEDTFVPLYSKELILGRSPASLFFHRQLWSCIKLLSNILSWHGILSGDVLKSLGIDSLLNRYIMIGLHNSPCTFDTILKLQVITSSLPREWFINMAKEGSTIVQLEHMARYLLHFANQAANINNRDLLSQIVKFLIKMRAEDHARLVITKFDVVI